MDAGRLGDSVRWFVYIDVDYYPYGEFVEAETVDEAVEKVRHGTKNGWAAVVTLADNVFIRNGPKSEYRFAGLEHDDDDE